MHPNLCFNFNPCFNLYIIHNNSLDNIDIDIEIDTTYNSIDIELKHIATSDDGDAVATLFEQLKLKSMPPIKAIS